MSGAVYFTTLGILWFCIGLDVWVFIRNWRLNRELRKHIHLLQEHIDRIAETRRRYEMMIAYPERNLTDSDE